MASDYDFGAAFAQIEEELIDSMMRNLRRYHLDWEKAEGFDWSQWQVEQLKYLEEYRRANEKKFGPRFARINSRLTEAIEHGYQNGQKAEEMNILQALAGNRRIRRRVKLQGISGAGGAFFRVNDRKLEALLTATQNDMQRAEYAVLRRSNDQYRKIIFQAQTYANTGAGTVEKAVDMATKDFLMRGIDCIEYKNGARHTISDYADMAIRTAERRAYLYGEGQKRQEWGRTLVQVTKRSGHPCPKCAKWIGRILIDDVYSGGRPDGKHTLLSEAMAQGFLHPRCKDGIETYFPELEDLDAEMDRRRGLTRQELREAEQAEEQETRQQNAENMAEKWDRRAKYSLDPDNKRAAEARAEEWHEEAEKAVTKPDKPDTINANKVGDVTGVTDFCELDRNKILHEFPDLPISRVVLTDERVQHIKANHPEDYVLFEKYGTQTITDPECILLDAKNPLTVMFIRPVEGTNLNVIVRLALAGNVESGKSHSVMTSYRLGAKTLKRLKKKNKILYIRE